MTDSKRLKAPRESSRSDWRTAMGLDPGFPLFPHQNGRWCRKVRGKFCYFGRVAEDPKGQAALALWLDQRDELLAGRTPRAKSDDLTLRDVCNHFLAAKESRLKSGELVEVTYATYFRTCEILVEHFGRDKLFAELDEHRDFEPFRAKLSRTLGHVALKNELSRVRSVLKFAFAKGLVEKPLRVGDALRPPSKKTIRLARAAKGERMLEAADLRRLINVADGQMKAMILLGLNCGFGNSDCAKLPLRALDLDNGWHKFERPKTGVARRCPLWPETVEAIKHALAIQPTAQDDRAKGCVFVTKYGNSWSGSTVNMPITKEFRKLLDDLKLHKPGIGFYTLRHVFETIGGEARDQVAVDALMGHVDASMAGEYRERISDERLQAVVDQVHSWLFPPPPAKKRNPGNYTKRKQRLALVG